MVKNPSLFFLMHWCHFKDTTDEILKELEMHLNFYRSDHGLLKVAKNSSFQRCPMIENFAFLVGI